MSPHCLTSLVSCKFACKFIATLVFSGSYSLTAVGWVLLKSCESYGIMSCGDSTFVSVCLDCSHASCNYMSMYADARQEGFGNVLGLDTPQLHVSSTRKHIIHTHVWVSDCGV